MWVASGHCAGLVSASTTILFRSLPSLRRRLPASAPLNQGPAQHPHEHRLPGEIEASLKV